MVCVTSGDFAQLLAVPQMCPFLKHFIFFQNFQNAKQPEIPNHTNQHRPAETLLLLFSGTGGSRLIRTRINESHRKFEVFWKSSIVSVVCLKFTLIEGFSLGIVCSD